MAAIDRAPCSTPGPPNVEATERLIAPRLTERVVVMDEQGGYITSNEGTAYEASVPRGTPDNCIITHNHPVRATPGVVNSPRAWGTTLGENDIHLAGRRNAVAIRVVTPAGFVAEMRRPEKGWPDPKGMNKNYREAYDEVERWMNPRGLSGMEAFDKLAVRFSHEVNRLFAQKIGATYRWGYYE